MSERQITTLDDILKLMHEKRASDVHLQIGSKPVFRVAGITRYMDDFPVITHEKLKEIIFPKLTKKQVEHFEERHGDIDFALGIPEVGRFRVNLFYQRGTLALVARLVQSEIKNFSQLHLPPAIEKICHEQQGLVIITGVTGCGKSTTLSSIIEYINQREECHILTIEDPIEFLYKNKKAYINQREVGIDVPSFKEALKYAVRQDPDVILIGEMRDDETVQFGLTAAETGHLVFGTLHSSNVSQTFGRILDLFPAGKHPQIRSSMRFNLKSILSQKLIPAVDPEIGRVPAVEMMFSNAGIKKLINDGSFEKMESVIETSKEDGMQTFNQSLYQLAKDGLITEDMALEFSPNPESLKMQFKGIIFKRSGLIGN